MAFPADYTLYQEVTIQASQVDGDLTDYVIYVNLADLSKAGADIFDTCRSDGGDIRVTKSDGTTELAREIVDIDTTAKTGELHVKFDGVLSSSTDTTIRIYYNGIDTEPAVTATYGRNNVWSDYDFVYHLNEAANNTTGGYVDSAGNNDATGSSMAIAASAGAAGNGQNFDGVIDYIQLQPAAVSVTGSAVTVSAFVKGTDSSGFIVSGYKAGSPFNGWNMGVGIITSGKVSLFTNSAGWLTGATSVDDDVLHQVVIKRDGSQWHIFVDGDSDATPTTGTYSNSGAAGGIAARQDNTNNLQAMIDEVRKTSSDLSASHIKTEHNNFDNTATFYSTGDEVGGSSGVTVTPSTQVISASVISPTVTAVQNNSVTANTQTIAASVITPTVTAATSAIVSLGTQTINISSVSIVVDAGGNITLAAGTQSIAVNAVSPTVTVQAGVVVSPATQAIVVNAISPTVVLGTAITVSVGTQSIPAVVVSPTVVVENNLVLQLNTQTIVVSTVSRALEGSVWGKIGWEDTVDDWSEIAMKT